MGEIAAQNEAVKSIMELSSKLADAVSSREDSFLKELHVLALKSLEEVRSAVGSLRQTADYSSNILRNILDNVGQGLLSFGRDLVIHKEYSRECHRIFGESIEDKIFSQLIYPEDKRERSFVERVLLEVFSCNEQHKINVFISLLPKEIVIRSKFISLDYKLISSLDSPEEKAVMVILTEITEKRLLENKIKEDEKIYRMVTNVAANFSGFMECVREFQYFYGSKLHEIMESSQSVSSLYANVFREIHTFKGSFSQFEMHNTVELLNSMETALSYVGGMLDKFTYKDLRVFIYSFDIVDFLNKDMEILQNKLGSHFLSMGEMIYVDKAKLLQIEDEIVNMCSPVECRVLLPLVKKLKYKSIKEMLSPYTDYAFKLAERMEKPINEFAIEGDDLLVDGEKYGGVIKAMIHIFRNCVDHGLESGEFRLAQGKEETGNITCYIKVENNVLEICIEDDGRGIDFEEVKKKAVKMGLLYDEDSSQFEEKDLIELIFTETFTTKDKVTGVSGRGMGLYSVKSEVDKLNGRIELITEANKGTQFRILLPIIDIEPEENLKAEEFVQPILNTTLDFMKEHFGSEITLKNITPFCSEGFKMMNYNSLINIRGLFDGLFCISMDNEIACALLKNMLYESIPEELENKYLKDVIAECANMILGNSIKAYPKIQELIIIGTPSVICSKSGELSYEWNMINGFKLETNKGDLLFSIIQ